MKKTTKDLPTQRMSVDQILAAARAVRAEVKRELTEKEINQAKRQGRA
jgi:hypothetical protein